MSFDIRTAHPDDAADLIAQNHALMQRHYRDADNHALDTAALAEAGMVFLVAEQAGAVLGCGALAMRGEHAEIKAMFTAPEARGKGVATALLQALEARARGADVTRLRLETGEALAEAMRLYRRMGFTRCGAFGDYPDTGASVFMEKRLSDGQGTR